MNNVPNSMVNPLYIVMIDKYPFDGLVIGGFSTYEMAATAVRIAVGLCEEDGDGRSAMFFQGGKDVARILYNEIDSLRYARIAHTVLSEYEKDKGP